MLILLLEGHVCSNVYFHAYLICLLNRLPYVAISCFSLDSIFFHIILWQLREAANNYAYWPLPLVCIPVDVWVRVCEHWDEESGWWEEKVRAYCSRPAKRIIVWGKGGELQKASEEVDELWTQNGASFIYSEMKYVGQKLVLWLMTNVTNNHLFMDLVIYDVILSWGGGDGDRLPSLAGCLTWYYYTKLVKKKIASLSRIHVFILHTYTHLSLTGCEDPFILSFKVIIS